MESMEEEMAMMKEHLVTRSKGVATADSPLWRMDAKGGGEVRRLHIVYFLSRMGKIEHPHLIRVHHLNRNGVRLRDVKRWLSELRGKGMPDCFAWSYKRRYKSGYVWQDLLDDDLITPISDNEYVLKGSEISGFSFDPCYYVEKKETTPIRKPDPVEDKSPQFEPAKFRAENEPEILSEIEVDSDVKKTVAYILREEGKNTEKESLLGETREKVGKFSSSSSSSSPPVASFCLLKNNRREKAKQKGFLRSNKCPSGPARVFRNLLSCGAAETVDSAVKKKTETEICKGEFVGRSEGISAGCWSQRRRSRKGSNSPKKSCEFAKPKPLSEAYKPVAEPCCSQCGKGFKPERLHSHMKSCKGLKSRVKERRSQASMEEEEFSTQAESTGLLLTH